MYPQMNMDQCHLQAFVKISSLSFDIMQSTSGIKFSSDFSGFGITPRKINHVKTFLQHLTPCFFKADLNSAFLQELSKVQILDADIWASVRCDQQIASALSFTVSDKCSEFDLYKIFSLVI